MIATCDVCHGPLAVTFRGGPRAYKCRAKWCVHIAADDLDRWVEEELLRFLSREDVFAALVRDVSSADLQAARDAVARLSAERVELLARLEEDDDPEVLEAKARRVRRLLLEAEDRVAELTTPVKLRGLITPGAGARAEWADATMARKREVVRELFVTELLGVLSVARHPGTRATQVPVADRVRLDGEPLDQEPAVG
jgi:hypothetical protein